MMIVGTKSRNWKSILKFGNLHVNFFICIKIFFCSLTVNVTPVMHNGKISRQFENFRIYKDMSAPNRDWVFPCQILLTSGGRCNRYFEDVRLKICRLLYFCMLFPVSAKIIFHKVYCFRFYRKWITWVQTLTTKDCKGPQTNMPKNVGSSIAVFCLQNHVGDQLLQKAYREENCDVTLPW